MKGRRLLAVARKEFLHVMRDPRSLGLGIAIPVVLLLLFGYVLTLDVDRIPLAVRDRSRTPESRELLSRFEGSRYFRVVLRAESDAEISAAIDEGRVLAALVLPENFSGRIRSDRSSAVQLLLDASEANTATIALGYAEALVSGYSSELELRWARAKGLQGIRPPLDVRPRIWFNADLESKNFIVPGLISVIMMIIAALLTSLTVAREWEQRTMEPLIATPVTGPELILGKLLPYFAIGMADLAVAVAMGEFLFHVPMRGDLFLLFGIAAVFLVGALSLGMLFGVAMRSQLPASQLAMAFTFLPSYLLSGFVFSIDSMPAAVRAVTYLVPARYFVQSIKGIYLKGVGLETLLPSAAMLLLFAAAALLAAARIFRKKLG